MVLVRNPEFEQWSAARPDGFPDRIVFRLEPDSDRQLNKQVDDVLEGRADLMYHPPPADRIAVLETTHAGQLHSDPSRRHVSHVPQRTHPSIRRRAGAPSAELRGRPEGRSSMRCLAGAASLPARSSHRPSPGTCPIARTPPTRTGRGRPRISPRPSSWWTFGYRGGQRDRMGHPWGVRGLDACPWGEYFVDLLDQLGYDAKLKVVTADRYFSAIDDPSQHVQMGLWLGRATTWRSRDSSRR